jgi:hypothetical protein
LSSGQPSTADKGTLAGVLQHRGVVILPKMERSDFDITSMVEILMEQSLKDFDQTPTGFLFDIWR